jgi:hypothetical protein
MTLRELCARNVSAGLREVLNAANCAVTERAAPRGDAGDVREIDDATEDLLRQAADCLERAAERLAARRREPAAKEPEPAAAPAATGAAPDGRRAAPAKKK